jgi:hypothetical protein
MYLPLASGWKAFSVVSSESSAQGSGDAVVIGYADESVNYRGEATAAQLGFGGRPP